MKRWAIALVLCPVLVVALAACGAASSAGPNDVHMSGDSFAKQTMTIAKGDRITLIADGFVPHVIHNGTSSHPQREPGAPGVNNLRIDGGSSATIGPFTTAGTFAFYCSLHPGMELSVTVHE
jgi:plastocyanin